MRQGTIPRDPPAGKQGVAPPVTDPVDRLLAGLENVKPSGNGWTAQCPAHEDHKSSLSVAEGQDGKALLTCHAGCSAEAIVQALRLEMRDLFPANTLPPQSRRSRPAERDPGVGLKQMAFRKLLPVEFLEGLGVKEVVHKGRPSLRIPYRNPDGTVFRYRRRTHLIAGKGSYWERGDGQIPYGIELERLSNLHQFDQILFVEGESDCWAGWHNGIRGTIGIPGATAWKSEWVDTEWFAAIQGREKFVWQEPGDAGAKFVALLAADIPDLRVIRPPWWAKDLSELHVFAEVRSTNTFWGLFNDLVEEAPLATELSDEATADGVEINTSGTFGDVFEGWPALIPLGPAAPKALPVDALPPWLANYVRSVAEATQTPPDMAILHALSVLSTAVANKILVKVRGGYMERAHIWTCTILGPANRKSAVVELLSAPIHAFETELAKSTEPKRRHAAEEREILERALDKARKLAAGAVSAENYGDARNSVHELADKLAALTVPAVPRLLASDVTSERLPQLMAENGGRMSMLDPEGDIFRIMAGRYTSGGVNFDHYKRAWTGEPIRDDRVGREGTHVPNPALTMGLTIQPSVLGTLQHAQSFRGEGLFARFLFGAPKSPIGARRTGVDVPPLDEEAQRRFGQGLRTLLELKPADVDEDGWWKPHVMELSPEARQVWSDWDAEVESQLRPGGDLSGIPDWGGKLVGNTVRIAAILHAANAVECGTSPTEGPVSGETMRAAVSLARTLISHAVEVFGSLDMTPEIRLARYVLDRILSAPDHAKLTRKKLWHRCKGKKEIQQTGDLNQPLALLEEHHHLRVENRSSTGGRPPSPAIVLNPAVLENIPKSTKSLKSAPPDGTSGTFGDVRGLCQVCGELEFLDGYCLLHHPDEADQ